MERHRFIWRYLRTTDFFQPGKKVLHIAPESCFRRRMEQAIGPSYIAADLSSPLAMVHLDVQRLPWPDQTFDIVYCSHVLEHVTDDRLAMRELRRVLKPDGWGLILVPIIATTTFEDPSVVDPEERLRLFGQKDHVRRYGPDYVDRLREAGFAVQTVSATDLFSDADATRLGVAWGGSLYVCRS